MVIEFKIVVSSEFCQKFDYTLSNRFTTNYYQGTLHIWLGQRLVRFPEPRIAYTTLRYVQMSTEVYRKDMPFSMIVSVRKLTSPALIFELSSPLIFISIVPPGWPG